MFRNRSRGGIFYAKNNTTGQRESLFITDKNRANELLVAKNESVRDASAPIFSFAGSRIFVLD